MNIMSIIIRTVIYYSLLQGSIIQVKILGVLAMIDCGETDWKVGVGVRHVMNYLRLIAAAAAAAAAAAVTPPQCASYTFLSRCMHCVRIRA